MALLLDIGDLPCCHTDSALDELFKSLAIEPGGALDHSIWAPHENPWITAHVEETTGLFSRILEGLQDTFARALTGEPIGDLQKASPPWVRWDTEQVRAAREHLEATPPTQYTADDWMLLVDFLIQRYLPDGVINNLAEYLSVRAQLLGKVQANLSERTPDAPALSTLTELIPTLFAQVPLHALTPVEQAVLRLAKIRCALHISDVTNGIRARMKAIVLEHLQASVLGQKEGTTGYLRQRLFDAFGVLNRDFRRIAVTEIGEACNGGFVAAQAPGARIMRHEAYRGACAFCQSISGKIFTVVSPDKPDRDGQSDIWVGKSNVGRSASPRKRVGGDLVQREPDELWWPAAGVQHPNCRGSWSVVSNPVPGADPAFVKWLDAELARALPNNRRMGL